MKFRNEEISTFINIYFDTCELIKQFEGCQHVELLQDIHDPSILSTLSIWNDENSLKLYRDSALFRSTWTKVKALFDATPQAHSYNIVES